MCHHANRFVSPTSFSHFLLEIIELKDSRDLGGGKSLIYQIPALISEGCTIVITPLISLMTDQVQNLSDRDISAEAIHAATTQPDIKSIMKRMLGSAGAPKGKKKKKVVVEDEEEDEGQEIKLVYVTPERIDKSKSFVSTLQKMYDAGRISRCKLALSSFARPSNGLS